MSDKPQPDIRRPGRPFGSFVYKEKLSARFQVMFTEEIAKKIRKQAAAEGIKPVALIRDIVTESLQD